MASADFLPPTFQQGRPFRRKARSPQIRHPPFTARPPDLRRLILDHESFAVTCPLALIGVASNPVSVRRPAASLHASFPRSVTFPQLRFASIAMASFREDFHLQGEHHAGRTRARPSITDGPHSVCYLFPSITALSLLPNVPPLFPTRSRGPTCLSV